MKYTVDYLSKQLKEASAIHDRYAKMLETDPDNAAVKIVARSIGDHVAEIKRDLKEARRAIVIPLENYDGGHPAPDGASPTQPYKCGQYV